MYLPSVGFTDRAGDGAPDFPVVEAAGLGGCPHFLLGDYRVEVAGVAQLPDGVRLPVEGVVAFADDGVGDPPRRRPQRGFGVAGGLRVSGGGCFHIRRHRSRTLWLRRGAILI